MTIQATKRSLATLLLALACLPAVAQDAGIKFTTDISGAIAQASREKKVVVMFFSSPTCQWCRKMSVNAFTDARVAALAGRFVWLKVDVTEQRALAALLQIEAVPTMVLLNKDGAYLDVCGGYQTPEQLLKYLQQWADKAESAGTALELPDEAKSLKDRVAATTTDAQRRELLAKSMELLGRPDRGGRLAMLEQIRQTGPVLWLPLATYLEDERLAVRAAAAEALSYATRASVEFNVFGEPAARKTQAQAWRVWIEKNKASWQPTTATSAPATLPAK